MDKRCVLGLLIFATFASEALGVTGNVIVYDDSDENGFNHEQAICGGTILFGETFLVHSGNAAIAVPKTDNNGPGWAGPSSFSTATDYDGVSFWVNAGSMQTTETSLAVYDAQSNTHFLHLEDMYGGPLPVNTWVQFKIPFSSPFFAVASSTPPDTVQAFCLLNHSSGGQTAYFYVDDVALTGADIFKNGFDS